jgi:hypothetical protein
VTLNGAPSVPMTPTAPAAGATVGPTATPVASPSQPVPDWLPVVLFAGPVIAVMLYLAARRARRS